MEKTCAYCGELFTGKRNAKFCSDEHRWRHHSAVKYEQVKQQRVQEAPPMAKQKDPAAQARGKSNRARGAQAERDVCHMIEETTGDKVRRNLSQTRDMGGDVKWGPLYLEVKYCRNISMPAWQAQAIKSASDDGEGLVPAVVHRRPGEPFWLSMPLHSFLALFQGLREAAKKAQNGPSEA